MTPLSAKKCFVLRAALADSPIVPLSQALTAAGHIVADSPPSLPSSPFYTVIVASLNKRELATVHSIAAAHPIVAVQISSHFPFIESLRMQAELALQKTVITIPLLRTVADFTIAASRIIAAADSMPPTELTAINTETPAPPMLSLAQLQQAAQALILGDNAQARTILAAVETVDLADLPPLARVLRLRLQIQSADDNKKQANDDYETTPANAIKNRQNDDKHRAAALLKQEIFNLSEEEKSQSGAPEFLAALKAHLALQDIF